MVGPLSVYFICYIQTNGPLDCWSFGLLVFRTNGASEYWDVPVCSKVRSRITSNLNG